MDGKGVERYILVGVCKEEVSRRGASEEERGRNEIITVVT